MTQSPLPTDPYAALGVSKDSTTDQIRGAYRKLVLKAHPDRFPNATPEEKQKKADEFHKIQQAYELLTDELRRQRYDERVKLAELKAELLKEQAASSKRTSRPAPATSGRDGVRSFNVPVRETTRPMDIYEEWTPKPTSKMAHEDDYPSTKFDARYDSSSKYDDYRSSPRISKQHDDYAFKNSLRRSSGRDVYSEELRQKDYEEREEKRRKKEELQARKDKEMQGHADKKKARDKIRREELDSKRYYSSPRVDAYTDSESEGFERFERRGSEPIMRKKAEEPLRRSYRDERSYARDRDDDYSDFSDEREHKHYYQKLSSKEREAFDHMRRHQKISSDPEERPRPSPRHSSTRRNEEPLPPPPPLPPAPPSPPYQVSKDKTDSAKRSSASRRALTRDSPPRESRSSRKEKIVPEIVDPAPKSSRRTGKDSTRARPGLKSTETAPYKLEKPFDVPRPATWETRSNREREREPASIRRTQTAPLEHMVRGGSSRDKGPHGSSKLRRAEIAKDIEYDYSSSATTGLNAHAANDSFASSTRTRYQVREESDDEEAGRTKPRIVSIGPEAPRASRRDPSPLTRDRDTTQSRDVSPHTMPHPGSRRPHMPGRSSASQTVHRTATFVETSLTSPTASPRAPQFGRSSTGRVPSGSPGPLFGEVRPGLMRSGTGASSTFYSMNDVNWAPKIDPSDIKYSSERRRTSPTERERDGQGAGKDCGSGGDQDRERGAKERSGDAHVKDGGGYGSRHGPSGLGRQASYAGKAY